MRLKLILALTIFPIVSSEIVYARTDRLDKAEFDQWKKTCGLQSTSKKEPFKVTVHVSKNSGTKKCVGVILNKRFVLTVVGDLKLNDYNNDADLRVATIPKNTRVVVCSRDGSHCELSKGLKEVGVKNILYPQLIHYSKAVLYEEYESVVDIALLEIEGEFTEEGSLCIPKEKESFKGQKIFLISDEINGAFIEGEWEWKGERTCGDATTCVETYTFKPATAMTNKPSKGLFYVQKNDRTYLLGFLKYEGESPKIMVIFPQFHDFICSNTGDCGEGYDEYMFLRETRVVLNGIPLPQVSHCDVDFTTCKYDPLFFRFLPSTEMEYLEKNCGKSLTPPSRQKKNKWHQFPHMAAIVNKGRQKENENICSGAFISQVHVVTVAHCLFQYNKVANIDEFLALRERQPGHYMNTDNLEVRYGSECYANNELNLNECSDAEMAKSIKISKVRNIIIEGLKASSTHWRYKYQLVLLELEQPTSKEVVIPICTFPGLLMREQRLLNNEKDRRSEVLDLFEFSAAGNPGATNSFVSASGTKISATDCSEFREDNRIQDYNCRDENVDVELKGKNPADGFSQSNFAFLGSQLSYYNATSEKRFLYGLAHYYSPHGKDNRLGAFYPIWRNERFICWFTGVCYNGRPDTKEDRHFKIYTPEYRLTRSIMDAPVQRAGKTNVSNYETVMIEEMDTQW
ncbi:hypothetical protein PRIPAC_71453 [Pristionchus pacificus]|uniref:Trypsin n=1 Tax=Pristionchus pacificus TaxID=54126 RepID=A0A2A6CS03_PRIPA|nr:hypothetical protein PRIPAC_71453 [Pristionchus pacificus]|eukprot:PDM80994.1 Trypsin [Pristionchus pacificus]